MTTLTINHCASCPLATREAGGWPACGAKGYHDPRDPQYCRTFDQDEYPTPPPAWCPLRQDPITLRVEQ